MSLGDATDRATSDSGDDEISNSLLIVDLFEGIDTDELPYSSSLDDLFLVQNCESPCLLPTNSKLTFETMDSFELFSL
jgi:hypothetical protein